MNREVLLNQIGNAVFKGEREETNSLVKKAISERLKSNEILDSGLVPGIRKAGDLFEAGEYFLPELIISSEAMKSAIEILTPIMKSEGVSRKIFGKVVIGTVEGDIHDIGKTLVGTILSTAGFEIKDLGASVPVSKFIEEAIAFESDFICASALLTTTMIGQRKIIETLKGRGLRDRFKVLVGGAPVSHKWADEIGADGYGQNAMAAVKVAKKLMGVV